MSTQSITSVGKVIIGTAIFAMLLSIIATVITYLRTDKINVMTLLGGIIIPLVAAMLVTMNKKRS